MIFGGYDATDNDPYCYQGTECLKNRLGIRDPKILEAFELEISTVRADEPLPLGRFSPRHYRQIHRHLFQDVYSWAGRYRTVRTAKGGHWFCYPENIAASMTALFRRLTEPAYKPGIDADTFLDRLTTFLADLNAIHPFREGNGRTQLIFIGLLGERAAHRLDLSRVERGTLLPAMIESFDGSVAPLREELAKLLV